MKPLANKKDHTFLPVKITRRFFHTFRKMTTHFAEIPHNLQLLHAKGNTVAAG
jgi:hypothetical protein